MSSVHLSSGQCRQSFGRKGSSHGSASASDTGRPCIPSNADFDEGQERHIQNQPSVTPDSSNRFRSPSLENEDDMDLFDTTRSESPFLDSSHPFSTIINELARHAVQCFEASLVSSSSVPSLKRSGDDWLPSDRVIKRVKIDLKAACYDEYMQTEQASDPGDEDLVIVEQPRPKATTHLICPFYAQDPRNHRSCLARADLRNIRDIKRHLWNEHRQPIHCPKCHLVFSTTAACDAHIRRRSCTIQKSSAPMEGVTFEQMQRLAHRADDWVPIELQWLFVWAIVFPEHVTEASGGDGDKRDGDEAAPGDFSLSPRSTFTVPSYFSSHSCYLSGETESVVCVARDYWSGNGKAIVSNFLRDKGLRDCNLPDEERNLDALHDVILDSVIDQLVETCNRDNALQALSGNTQGLPYRVWRAISTLRRFHSAPDASIPEPTGTHG